MTNPFDQFDAPQANPFDQFDAPVDQPAIEQPSQSLAAPSSPRIRDQIMQTISGFKKMPSALRDPVRATLQGPTIGYSDELGSGVAALAAKGAQKVGLLPDTGESVGDIYSGMQSQVSGEQKEYAKENPATALGLELAGAVPLAIATGGASMPSLASKVPAVANVLSKAQAIAPTTYNALRGAAMAAPVGAAYGAGTAEQGERMEGAKKGGTVAALFGAGLPLTAAIFTKGAGYVSPVLKSLRKEAPEKADEIIANMLKKSGLTPEDFAKKIDDLGLEAVAADVDEDILGQAQAYLSKSSGLKGEVADALHRRQTGQQADFIKSFTDELGDAGGNNLRDALEKTAKKRSELAGPLYKKAFASDFADDLSKNPIFRKDEVQEALKAGEKIARAEVGRSPGILTPVEKVHYAKKALWDKAQGLRKDQPEYARAIDGQRKEIDKILNSIPEYKEARNIWSSSLDREAAADIGKNIMKPSVDAEDFIYEFKRLGDSEAEMAKLSALKEIVKKIETKGESGSVASQLKGTGLQKKVRAMFGSDDAFNDFLKKVSKWETFERTRNRATAGRQSITQPNLAEGEISAQNLKKALPSIENAIDALLGKISKAKPEDISREVARKLLTREGAQEVKNVLTAKPAQKAIGQSRASRVLPATVLTNKLVQE